MDALHLDHLDFNDLLKVRVSDLDLSPAETWLDRKTAKLLRELQAAGIFHLKPKTYFGDEWFCPDGALTISVPFFLCHPRLKALEKRFAGEVEGGTARWFDKLMRHEAGHCFDHAYKVSRRARWIKLFGNRKKPYAPDNFSANQDPRNFVDHLGENYAQCHPDEDFAETFATVITPNLNWRKKYRHYPEALAKLSYVDELIKELGYKPPVTAEYAYDHSAKNLRIQLRTYYKRRKQDESKSFNNSHR